MSPLERYVRHAERFGVELVFETAAGLGAPDADLTIGELVQLARRLIAIDARFDSARPDKLVELSGAETRVAYLERIPPVLDALRTPAPASTGRCCEWCGNAIAGRADRRTCSGAHREALRRDGGLGPFSTAHVTVASDPGLRVGLDRSVTPRGHKQRLGDPENRGGPDFREVSAGAVEKAAGVTKPQHDGTSPEAIRRAHEHGVCGSRV
jgi:hypothetical protein